MELVGREWLVDGWLGGGSQIQIEATVAPVIAATDDSETPATNFTQGTFASTIGATVSVDSTTYYADGVEVASDYDLQAGEVLYARVVVVDDEVPANSRTFQTASVVVTPSIALGADTVPVISGTAEVGETLSTTDGTWTGSGARTYSYQWKRDTVAIDGATASTYLLVAADDGAEITVTVTATDGFTSEAQTSAATATVTYAAPSAGAALGDQTYAKDSAITAFDTSTDFTGDALTFALAPTSDALPAGLSISSAGVITGTPTALAVASIVVRATNSGGTADSGFTLTVASAPAQASAPTLTAGDELLTVTFPADPDDNNSAITQWDVRYSTDEATWTESLDFTDGADITGLTNGTTYYVQVRAVNAFGNGAWSASASAEAGAWTPADLFKASEIGGIYDPSDISTLWQDSARTTPVTADGDPVGCIEDLSGNGNHMIQTSAANKPLYKTSGGLHWLEQQDAADWMGTSGQPLSAEENFYVGGGFQIQTGGGISTRLFAVCPENSGSTTAGAFGIYQRSDVVQRVIAAMRVNAGTTFEATVNSAYTIGGAAFRAEAYHESNTIYARANALSASAAANDDNTPITFRPIGIFASSGAVAKFYGGVIIDRVLTTDEKTAVRAWIDARIGA